MRPNRIPSSRRGATTPAPAGIVPPGAMAPPEGETPPATTGPWRLIVFLFVVPLVGVLLLEHFDVPQLLSNWLQKLLG